MGIPVTGHVVAAGCPLLRVEVDRRLSAAGVPEVDGDATPTATAVLSAPSDWTFSDETCWYAAELVDGLPTDGPVPGKGRHQWLLKQNVRLACAHRLGCITEDDREQARKLLDERFVWLVRNTAPCREPSRDECAGAARDGIGIAATKTDEEARAELGRHDHDDWMTMVNNATGSINPATGAGKAKAAATIDEATFWNAYPELTACRDYARSVRVGPWAMLGSALTVAAATIPPHVVLPAGVGDYASVNLYVNLVGESGSIKSQAVAAARAWLQIVSPPDPVKPGSGQGVAKCFAYVKRTKNGPVQVGKRWTAVAAIPEVDTLTTAGSMTGSSLWAELRSAWSDERVGHDYADATKSVVLQPLRYRLCMIVGVQPLRAGPIFDDVDAGTPQRFVWFPVDDPGRPEKRPDPKPPLKLPGWQENWMDPSSAVADYFNDIDQKLANQLDKPCDRSALQVLKIPAEAEDIVDVVAREKLSSSPNFDPLDGHQKLCQLKVAAALMRLCNRTEVTSKDWELAGIVMAISDRTRAQVKTKLDDARTRRNLDTAKASGARKIFETRMAAKAEAEDIARVADVIVTALTKANGHTMTGSAVRRAAGRGRDRTLVPKALEYLEIDGRIRIEQVKQAGVKVTLLSTGQQTP